MNKHDKEAVLLVAEHFCVYGFLSYAIGTELDDPQARKALLSQHDSTSIMLRYRPDRFFTKNGNRSVLCEVKCEYAGYSNFAVEFDSFTASKQWNTGDKHVMYAFVDLQTREIKSCWANNVPMPVVVYVPMRNGWNETHNRLKREYPGIRLDPKPHKFGSGTPYFLLPKAANYLVNFDQFISKELLSTRIELSRVA